MHVHLSFSAAFPWVFFLNCSCDCYTVLIDVLLMDYKCGNWSRVSLCIQLRHSDIMLCFPACIVHDETKQLETLLSSLASRFIVSHLPYWQEELWHMYFIDLVLKNSCIDWSPRMCLEVLDNNIMLCYQPFRSTFLVPASSQKPLQKVWFFWVHWLVDYGSSTNMLFDLSFIHCLNQSVLAHFFFHNRCQNCEVCSSCSWCVCMYFMLCRILTSHKI